jgi:hypothetical protein
MAADGDDSIRRDGDVVAVRLHTPPTPDDPAQTSALVAASMRPGSPRDDERQSQLLGQRKRLR